MESDDLCDTCMRSGVEISHTNNGKTVCVECAEEEPEPVTVVMFRKWSKKEGGGILALFPCVAGTNELHTCSCYEHHSQHGSADLRGMVRKNRPATPEEYADLKAELERIGYRLRIVSRTPNNAYALRRAEIERVHAVQGENQADTGSSPAPRQNPQKALDSFLEKADMPQD